MKTTACAMAISMIFASGMANAWVKDKTYQITILHTNDHHGRFWNNNDDEYGLAAQKTLVDQVRKEVAQKGGSMLLLSGGDINTGVPESDLQKAEPDFRGMRAIGYDAMALGNHEFDNKLEVIRQQQKWANFPLLGANIYQKSTQKRLFDPYKIFDKQGVKIAVIGLTTDDTAKIGNPENQVDIEFKVPAIEAKKVIDDLRKNEKPDIIIAATHMGHYDDGKSGSNAPGDVEMARQLPKGYLDMIVGGHSQDPVCMKQENYKNEAYVPGTECAPDRQNGTWIVQAHEWGKYVGRADFEFRNGEFTLKHYQLIPINLQKKEKSKEGKTVRAYYTHEIKKDKAMLDLLTPFQERGQAKLNVNIGKVAGNFDGERSTVRFKQSNLGHLILSGWIERTGADFAVMSGGGIRDSIREGDISYKDVLIVQPFGNVLAYMEMKGRDVAKYLDVVANITTDSGGYAQFMNVSLLADGKRAKNVKIKGKPLEMNKTYRFALLSFNAVGGDGYPKVSDKKGYVNTGFIDAEVLKDYIEKHSPLDVSKYQPKGEILYK